MSGQTVDISGKVAIVTGASGGIGEAIAKGLAKAGVKVACGARRQEVLEATVKAIVDGGGQAIAVQTDVASREQVKNLVAKAEETFGPVDILVNNAAVFYLTLMKNGKEDEWEKMVDVNCKGVLNGIGAVLSGMVERKSGHIINISSDSGREATPTMAVYSGTKFFVEGLSLAMRKEVAGYGVRVTSIQPGYVETPGVNSMANFDPEATEKLKDQGEIVTMKPEDIANAVIYAVSQPSYVAVNEILIQPTTQDAI